jgi:hypothetical protein
MSSYAAAYFNLAGGGLQAPFADMAEKRGIRVREFPNKKQTCSVFLLSLCGKGRIMLPFTQIFYHENLV